MVHTKARVPHFSQDYKCMMGTNLRQQTMALVWQVLRRQAVFRISKEKMNETFHPVFVDSLSGGNC